MAPPDEDLLAHLSQRFAELEGQIRDLTAICALLTHIAGRDVGLGSYQVRIPADQAFAIRQQLPEVPSVVMTFEANDGGAMIITVV